MGDRSGIVSDFVVVGAGLAGLETALALCAAGADVTVFEGRDRVGGPGGNPHGPGFSSRKDEHHDLPCRLCHGVGS